MAATLLGETIPQAAHVGFDHGWLLLGPSFLNLGMPMLLVDKVYLGDVAPFGLERFGTRDPRTPLPTAHLVVERSGRFIGIRDDRSGDRTLIAIGAFADLGCLDQLSLSGHLVLASGDTNQPPSVGPRKGSRMHSRVIRSVRDWGSYRARPHQW